MSEPEDYGSSAVVPSVESLPTSSASETDIQTVLLNMWKMLLQVEHVEVGDNFLLLGGESLLAMQVAVRIKELFDYELSIRSIFTKSLAEIAAEIAAAT